MSLPYPSMVFVPLDILTAEEMNQLVSNIESLSTGTGLADGAITSDKIDWASASGSVPVSDYITFASEITINSADAYKITPNLVLLTIDIAKSLAAGMTTIGTCTSKVAMRTWGSGRMTVSYSPNVQSTMAIQAIPGNNFNIYTPNQTGVACAGSILLIVND